MTRDGRGELIRASWYSRAYRWLASSPLTGLILGAVGVTAPLLRYRDRRAARLQAASDRERGRLARDRARRWPTR